MSIEVAQMEIGDRLMVAIKRIDLLRETLSGIEAKAQIALDGPSKGGQAVAALRDIITACDRAMRKTE